MDSHTFGLIELTLVFGLVFGWGARELWLLRRDRIRRERDAESEQKPRN
ncbi:MAG: hypothetical protein SF172_11535 [Burkholderiales bacterium]|nr:hypothetical protein [Burkholderiales bacterium]